MTEYQLQDIETDAILAARRAGADWPAALKAGRNARAAAKARARTTEPLPAAAIVGPRVATVELDE